MRMLFFLILLLFHSGIADITEIRGLFIQASNSEESNRKLIDKLEKITKSNEPVLVAYKGASLIMISRFEKNLVEKINRFKEGANLIDYAVKLEPDNTEIRLIRLSVQENVPKITNYKKDIKEDKAFILSHLETVSNALKEYVVNFIVQSKCFSEAEKKGIKK